jgi:Fe-S-cluster-containing hydrogenase component 2
MKRRIIAIDEARCDGCGLCAEACNEGAIGVIDGVARLLRDDYCDGLGNCLPVCPSGAITFVEREADAYDGEAISELKQWPVQIRLVHANAPFFEGAHLLIAADCAAYARAGFHAEFMRGRVTLIGCPKLDGLNYAEKLAEIITENNVKSLTVARMEVPCCGGIEQAADVALKNSGKSIPLRLVTLGTDGEIREG